MNHKKTPFCKVPFLIGFTTDDSRYRDCCSKQPQVTSNRNEGFERWWNGQELKSFRKIMMRSEQHPRGCESCKIAEQQQGSSFRTAVNKWEYEDQTHPSGWNIVFGNTCNLGCWSCNENSSSVIFQHKKRAGLLSGSDRSETNFQQFWPELRTQVLKSYEYHKTVNLTLLGGEPLYNKTVQEFLNNIIELDLAKRTRLEFHTNGTVYPHKILRMDKTSPWQHVSTFISLDAVGPYAEWLRYGCSWDHVDTVVDSLIETSNYTEIHCTLTVLNINQLPQLRSYAQDKKLRLNIITTEDPEFMSLKNWDLPKSVLLVKDRCAEFQTYYDLIGTTPKKGASDRLVNYIRKFDGVRRPLIDFDRDFAQRIGW